MNDARLLAVLRSRILRNLSGAVLLLTVCCGCPPMPPSQEEQEQSTTSRWITVELRPDEDSSTPAVLDQDDFEAIAAQLPTVESLIAECDRVEHIAVDDADAEGVKAEADICGTQPEALRLLQDHARMAVQRGRFLVSADSDNAGEVVVLSARLAERLFPQSDPIGRIVRVGDHQLTVVGVMSEGAEWGVPVVRDAWVPVTLFTSADDDGALPRYDRLRVRVSRLEQVDDTRSVIQALMEARHPDHDIRVH